MIELGNGMLVGAPDTLGFVWRVLNAGFGFSHLDVLLLRNPY
mgnify:CR=1 FL=1